MADVRPLSDDERAELVAYLDGEADQRAAREIEARLNRDPRLQAEAEAMRRAWQLLDFLPKPEPSPQFTHRTMTAASVIPPAKLGVPGMPARPWLLGLGWAAGLVAMVLTGYAAAPLIYRTSPPPPSTETEQRLARDLRIIENLRLYQVGQDLPFVNELDRPELFGDEHSGF